jgi:hypothetical protein
LLYDLRGLQSPFARTEHDLSLPEPVKGTILAPKSRESGECRIIPINWSPRCQLHKAVLLARLISGKFATDSSRSARVDENRWQRFRPLVASFAVYFGAHRLGSPAAFSFFFEPLGPDEGLFLTMAVRVLHGARLYTEIWDNKPIGIPHLYCHHEFSRCFCTSRQFGERRRGVRVLMLGLSDWVSHH